uniref:Solute carrier family 12 member 10, tandem duplicate 3 n=1 Tax=Sinocyclocheilus grahami TaxID=75366 RepID=A0A672NRG9_SINGR
MSKYIERIRNLIPGLRRPNNGPPQGDVTVDMGEADFGKEKDMRKMSFFNPLDPVPKYDFYAKDTWAGRIKKTRPSLDVLRKPVSKTPEEDGRPKVKLVRFGWVLGVMIRAMLNIWGVIMYLRLPWITSQAGLILTYVIIFMSIVVTTITATSVSAISTNGKIYSGGTYFMISRSLGPELGAPIGLLFAFANAIACALHTVGFAETVRDLLKDYDSQMVDDVNDVRIVGAITVVILLCITFAGMAWEAKAQILFFIAIMLSLINYFVGTVIPTNREKESVGFFGYRDIFVENLLPSFRGPNGYFFRLFAIFFPAATGILSGVNICGDLKDPTGGIPKGTLLAILWTTLSYLLISVTSATVVRDASGNVNDSLALTNFTTHCTGLGCKLGWNFDRCEQNRTCSHGLANNLRVSASCNYTVIIIIIINYMYCTYYRLRLTCWRPEYHFYSPWTSLFGSFLSFILMFLFTWWAALVTFFIVLFLLGYVTYTKPKVNWGTSYQAGFYNMALSFSMSLSGVEDHLTMHQPLTCKHFLLGLSEDEKSSFPQHSSDMLVDWLNQRKVRSFYTSFTADSLKEGTHNLMQASGLGKLKPNTLVLGYKMNWQECKPESLQDYVNTISDAFDSSYGIAILRMMDGLDVTDNVHSADISDDGSNEQVRSVFQTKQGRKSIDIYWISDDGGLTLLVPYLLTRRNRWKKCKLRVFILGDQETIKEDRKDMKMLLKRFRLEIEDLVIITDVDKAPLPKNLQRYEETIAPFRLSEEQAGGDVQELKRLSPWKISNKDLEAIQPKIESTLRLNEIIKKNSIHAALVAISLPVPDVTCPSSLYMSWMDALSYGIHCPVLLIRGNQENVMTFYCQ